MEKSLFEYPSTPVTLETRTGVQLQDVSFRSPSGNQIDAYVVSPGGAGPYPAILYVHWYETFSPIMNRTQFLNEGIALAQHGVVSLHISTMWSDPHWYPRRDMHADFAESVKQVVDLRRALDVLTSRADVDQGRIAYVGHDFGAMYGVVLSSVDARPSAYVLIAGAPAFEDWMLYSSTLEGEVLENYLESIRPLDPFRHVGKIAPRPILFQFGKGDFYVPDERVQVFFEAANEPKKLEMHDGGHGLDERARDSRVRWLQEQLGFTGAVLIPPERPPKAD